MIQPIIKPLSTLNLATMTIEFFHTSEFPSHVQYCVHSCGDIHFHGSRQFTAVETLADTLAATLADAVCALAQVAMSQKAEYRGYHH